MRTYSAKPSDVARKWYIVDASTMPLGRVATRVATLLTGKAKPQFTRHIDCGDFVIVINANNIVTTGGKLNKKIYYRHSGYPGGLKSASLQESQDKDPTKAITQAIRGMIPDNKLRAERMKRLKVYADSEHRHEAQKPTLIDLKEMK
ncbi:MAG TPA: 50S ribosomal protein L13 [Candidatus Saccharimonadales bacterium]|nr:50S ribosomal protein L13 [Candidatus Saccharimonadales bacterium]